MFSLKTFQIFCEYFYETLFVGSEVHLPLSLSVQNVSFIVYFLTGAIVQLVYIYCLLAINFIGTENT